MTLPLPSDWTEDALCAQLGIGAAHLWFPERGDNAQTGKEICRRCPVQEPCLEYALALESSDYARYGTWGATVPRGRMRIARQRREAA